MSIPHDETTNSNACAPVQDTLDDNSSLFNRIKGITFHMPDFDKFCVSGDVIDEAKVESGKVIEAGVEKLPAQTQVYARAAGTKISAGSSIASEKVKGACTSGFEVLKSLPANFMVKWNEAKEVYHENKRAEEEAERDMMQRKQLTAAPPVSTVAVL